MLLGPAKTATGTIAPGLESMAGAARRQEEGMQFASRGMLESNTWR
jgi:hypothetical protein